MHELAKAWLSVELSHNISKTASDQLWKLALASFKPLLDAKIEDKITKKTPQFPQLRKYLYKQYASPISVRTGYKNEQGELIIKDDSTDSDLQK